MHVVVAAARGVQLAARMALAMLTRNATWTSSRSLRGFEMNGDCAAVAHHDNWEDEATGVVSKLYLFY